MPEPPIIPRTAFAMMSPARVGTAIQHACEALTSRFRIVRCRRKKRKGRWRGQLRAGPIMLAPAAGGKAVGSGRLACRTRIEARRLGGICARDLRVHRVPD